jgi:hypothetical protein
MRIARPRSQFSSRMAGGAFSNDMGNPFRPDPRRVLIPADIVQWSAARKVSSLLSRVTVISPRSTLMRTSKSCACRSSVSQLAGRVDDLEALATQVALEGLACQRPTVTTAAGDIGDTLGADCCTSDSIVHIYLARTLLLPRSSLTR